MGSAVVRNRTRSVARGSITNCQGTARVLWAFGDHGIDIDGRGAKAHAVPRVQGSVGHSSIVHGRRCKGQDPAATHGAGRS